MDNEAEASDVATTNDSSKTQHKPHSKKKGKNKGNENNGTVKSSAEERKNTGMRKKVMRFRNYQVDDEDPRKATWTVREKTSLLKALRKYGWKKIDKITAEMPTKTKEQIEYFIDSKKRQTRYLLAAQTGSTKFPIELWLEKSMRLMARKPNYSKALSETLGLIGKLENHDPIFGPNCENLYGFLQGLLSGEPPKELNAFESRIVLHLIQMLAALLRHLPLEEITKEINNPATLLKEGDITRTYSRENLEDCNGETSISSQSPGNERKSPIEYIADIYDDIGPSRISDSVEEENLQTSEPSTSGFTNTSLPLNSDRSPLKADGTIPSGSKDMNDEPKSNELFSVNPLSISLSLLKKTYKLARNTPVFKP